MWTLIVPFLGFWLVFHVLSVLVTLLLAIAGGDISQLLSDKLFWRSLWNSTLYTLVVIPLQAVAFLLACALYALARRIGAAVTLLAALFYMPTVIAIASVGFIFKLLLADQGWVNDVLQVIAGIKLPWLSHPSLALFSCMLVTFWKGLGYYMIIYFSALLSINQELIEQALVDGWNNLQILLYILVPQLRGTIALCTFMSLMAAMRVFAEVFILTAGGPGTASYTLMLYVYDMILAGKLGQAALASLILSILLCIVGAGYITHVLSKQYLHTPPDD